jgi:hypothetical protein
MVWLIDRIATDSKGDIKDSIIGVEQDGMCSSVDSETGVPTATGGCGCGLTHANY